jgi:putative transposase
MSECIQRGHNVSLLLYHIACTAKYRRAVFSAEVDTALRDVFPEANVEQLVKAREVVIQKRRP